MPDLPKVHTGQRLVPMSDDDLAHRADDASWTLTEALFLLSGHKPPGYESTRHLQDHFWCAYRKAHLAIRAGDICRETKEAGEHIFFDRPARWLAWADKLGPERFVVDDRVRKAIQGPQPSDNSSSSKPSKSVAPEQSPAAEAEVARRPKAQPTRPAAKRRRRGGPRPGPYLAPLNEYLEFLYNKNHGLTYFDEIPLNRICENVRQKFDRSELKKYTLPKRTQLEDRIKEFRERKRHEIETT